MLTCRTDVISSQRSVVQVHYRPHRQQFYEELPLRELPEILLGQEGRRRLELRQMTNEGLFELYDNDLVIRLHNAKNLSDTRRILARFKEYLNGYPPSPQLAKGFVAQYANHKPRTLYRYAMMLKVFMKWYGEPMDDLKVRVPKTLPPYTEDSQVEGVRAAIENKRSWKRTIIRDLLLVDVARVTGMRRGELENLEPKHIHADFLVVRNGKGGKDQVIPLIPVIAESALDRLISCSYVYYSDWQKLPGHCFVPIKPLKRRW